MRVINPIYFVTREVMRPPSLLITVIFVLLNILFFMVCEDDLQRTLHPSKPFVQSILHEKNDVKNHNSLDLETNRKYCDSPHETCKFLFIYSLPLIHVDPKSNGLIRTFSHIAHLLNRTMVLPNVGHAKVSSCSRLPFNYYYDIEALRRISPTVNFITQSEFERWTKERLGKPIAQHLHITNGTNTQYMISQIDPPQDFSHHHRVNCFDRFDMRLDRESTYHRLQIERGALSNLEKHKYVADLLTKTFFHSDAEVLLIKSDVSQDTSSQKYPIIPYSTHIVREASKIKTALEPYVAVHWKMAEMRAENMYDCVERLKSTLTDIRDMYGIQNVYLSTDYPISPELARPNSHRRFKKHHHRAMMMLNSAVNISSWVSLNAFSKTRQETINISSSDSGSNSNNRGNKFKVKGGVRRILDQMVCVSADYFLSGPAECCKQWNVFTRVVGNSRQEISETEDKKLLNIMTRW